MSQGNIRLPVEELDELGIEPEVAKAAMHFMGMRPADIQHENVQWLVYNIQQAVNMNKAAASAWKANEEATQRLATVGADSAKIAVDAARKLAANREAFASAVDEASKSAVTRIEQVLSEIPEVISSSFSAKFNALADTLSRVEQVLREVEEARKALAAEEVAFSARIQNERDSLARQRSVLEHQAYKLAGEWAQLKRERNIKRGFWARAIS